MLHISSGFIFDQNEALIVFIFPFVLWLGGMCTWGSVAEVDEAQFKSSQEQYRHMLEKNKHFSLDTCINSLLVQLKIQNAYFSFCLAFLEHLVMNLEVDLHSKTSLFICICCLSYGRCPWWLTME